MFNKLVKLLGFSSEVPANTELNVPADLMTLYEEIYPVLIHFHKIQSLAPHAATMNTLGEIEGSALTTNGEAEITVEYTLNFFENAFKESAKSGDITASAIFYHGSVISQSNYRPAQTAEEANAIIGHLENKSLSLVLLLSYYYEQGAWKYREPFFQCVEPRVFLTVEE